MVHTWGFIAMIEYLQDGIIQQALLALLLLIPLCALMGSTMLQMRLSYFGDSISHSAFSGLAIGMLLAIEPRAMILLFAILISLLMTYLQRHTKLALDSVIGVIQAGTVAFGLIVLSLKSGGMRSMQAYLFGDLLLIQSVDLAWLLLTLVLVALYQFIFANQLILMSLHAELSATHGVKTRWHPYIHNMLLALVVAVGLRAIGLMLITALLVVPAAAARNVASNVRQMFWLNLAFAAIAALAGLGLSLYGNVNLGGAVVMVAIVLFFTTAFLRKRG